MAITPWYKGDTLPIWTIQLVPDSGAFNVAGLTGSNFALLIRNADTGVETSGTGTFSNVTAAVTSGSTVTSPASVQYALSSADAATLGNYVLFVVATFPSGGTETFSVGAWQVVAK